MFFPLYARVATNRMRKFLFPHRHSLYKTAGIQYFFVILSAIFYEDNFFVAFLIFRDKARKSPIIFARSLKMSL